MVTDPNSTSPDERFGIARFRNSEEARRAEAALTRYASEHDGIGRVRVHTGSIDPAVGIELRNTAQQRRIDRGLLWRIAVPVVAGIAVGIALDELAAPAAGRGASWTFICGILGFVVATLAAFLTRRRVTAMRRVADALERGETVVTIQCDVASMGRVREIVQGHSGSLLGVA